MGEIEKQLLETYVGHSLKVTVHLGSNEAPEGVIKGYDNDILSLEVDGKLDMIYRRNISWIEVCKK